MLLQRLIEFAATLEQVAPYAYADVIVRYEVHLDSAGNLLTPAPIDLASADNKYGQRRQVPQVRRSGTRPPPLLLADHAEYTLGLPRTPENADKAPARHADYMSLLDACAEETRNPLVAAVQSFLAAAPLDQIALPADFNPTAVIEFRVDGQLVTQEPDVKRFWAARNRPADDQGDLMQCIVCGQMRPVLARLTGVIKGIPKGNATGTAIISANADAFESYGLAASHVAPICADCANHFTKGINHLLASKTHSVRTQDVVHLFWTGGNTDFQIAGWFDAPDPLQVRELINSLKTAHFDPTLDATPFYAVALTASNARAVVRDWLDTTLAQVKRNLALWFQRQAIVDPYGEASHPFNLYKLAAATVFDIKKANTAQTVTALLRCGLLGTPLPDSLLMLALQRCRAEHTVTHARAALLKLVLLSQDISTSATIEETMIALEPTHPDPAYQCGRLLALLEIIQRRAADAKLNTTLIDRFYGSASSTPATVFGTLLRGAQPHLAKLRRNRPAVARYLEDDLEEVLGALSEFPATLTVKQQALFALGYYHQRAHDHAAARAGAEARKLALLDADELLPTAAPDSE